MSVSTSSPGRSSTLHHHHHHLHFHQRPVTGELSGSVSDSSPGYGADISALIQANVSKNAQLFQVEHDRSLQELDEAVASAEKLYGLYSTQLDGSATLPNNAVPTTTMRGEPQQQQRTRAEEGTVKSGGRQGEEERSGEANTAVNECPFELQRVISGQSMKSFNSQSERTGRAKRPIRNSSRKRGDSLERDISRTILETAILKEPHFLMSTREVQNCVSRSAQFILSDLFAETASAEKPDDMMSLTFQEAPSNREACESSPAIVHGSSAFGNNDTVVQVEDQYDTCEELIYSISTSSEQEEKSVSATMPPSVQQLSYPMHNGTGSQIEGTNNQTEETPSTKENQDDLQVGSAIEDDLFDGLDPVETNSYEDLGISPSPGDMRIDVIKEEDEETESCTANGDSGNTLESTTSDGTGTLVFPLVDDDCLSVEDCLLQYSSTTEVPIPSETLVQTDDAHSVESNERATCSRSAGSAQSSLDQERQEQKYGNEREQQHSHDHDRESQEKNPAVTSDAEVDSITDQGFENFFEPPGVWTSFDDSPFNSDDAAFAVDDDDAFLPFQDNTSQFKKNSHHSRKNNSNIKVEAWKRRSQRSRLVLEATATDDSPKKALSEESLASPSPQSPSSIIYFNSNILTKNAASPNNNLIIGSSSNSSNNSGNRLPIKTSSTKKLWHIPAAEKPPKASI